MLRAAIELADLGYPVFPCAPGKKQPLCAHGFRDATTDVARLEAWWQKHPPANIGIPTEGLVVVDVDGPANDWLADQHERRLELADSPTALTPRGGRHHFFRQPPGKLWGCTEGRLAHRVDTRANGGYVVAPPSVLAGNKTYRWAEGLALSDPPEKLPTPPEWLVVVLDSLAAKSATDSSMETVTVGSNPIPRGQRNGTLARLAGTMRRVGMSAAEIAAALHCANLDRCRPPLPPTEVDAIAASVARYAPDQVAVAVAERHWEQMHTEPSDGEDEENMPGDPGPLPQKLLRIPGFISEVMEHCLATAPYPNVVLAFAGAVALQALLAGRKVRDPGDNRTNLYLLGLAHSSAGKDWPRKLNLQIAHRVGLADCLGERFASGEGLQDALFLTPSMLFQTDEIDGLLQSINGARDHRHEAIMTTLLTMYSSAASVFPMRRKAGQESAGVIDQPSLVVFGTAIPNHYYAALSERMLTNGLFARMLILESGRRGAGQEPMLCEPPERVLETAAWWAEFAPGTGNLRAWHPEPLVVEQTPEAQRVLVEARLEAESEYARCEERSDAVGTTVWGRVSEQARKLSLLYAVSANHLAPSIDKAAARWAVQLAMHQTRRMLFMASQHVSNTEFEQRCKQVVDAVSAWQAAHGDAWMPYRDLSRKYRWSRREHDEIRDALVDQERIEIDVVATGGRPRVAYRLRPIRAARDPA